MRKFFDTNWEVMEPLNGTTARTSTSKLLTMSHDAPGEA